MPDDVTINGHVTVDAFNASDAGNATQNFWRSAENMKIVATGLRNCAGLGCIGAEGSPTVGDMGVARLVHRYLRDRGPGVRTPAD